MTLFKDQYEALRQVNNLKYIEASTVQNILELVTKIDQAKLYRGKGGEVMRNGVCRLIECISVAQLPIPQELIKVYMTTLDESIQKPLEELQESAECALRVFSKTYQSENIAEFEKFVENFLNKGATDPNVVIRRGYTRALSCLSLAIVRGNLEKICKVLEENCTIKGKEQDDADARKFAIKSYQEILSGLLEEEDKVVDSAIVERFFRVAFSLMADYTTDKRGDIGSMVREASMYSMVNILKVLAKKYRANKDFGVKISGDTVFRCVALMLQQLVEKIDRTRLIAGSLLQDLVDHHLKDLPSFKGVERIQALFNKEYIQQKLQAEQERLDTEFSLTEEMKGKAFDTISTQQMNFGDVNLSNTEGFIYYWNLPHCVYPLVTPLLEVPEFSYFIVKILRL